MSEFVRIRILRVPLELYVRGRAQIDSLLRELAVLRSSSEATRLVPDRLLALLEELQAGGAGGGPEREAQVAAALERGDSTIDLDYEVRPQDGQAIAHLAALFDEADDFCRAGHALLTAGASRDVRAVRRWFFAEFARQLAGEEPRPWDDSLVAELGGDEDVDDDGVDRPPVQVQLVGEIDLVAAPDVRESLLKVVDSGVRRIDVDASGVTFLDSLGISVLLAVHVRLRERGGSLRIVKVSPEIETTLRFVGVPEFLPQPT